MTAISKEHRRGDRRTKRHSASRAKFALYATILALLLAFALPLPAQDQKDSRQPDNEKDGIGFNLGQNASARDVGLPIYPGSRRHQDNDEDNSTLNMGLWGGNSGFKLFVMKMETTDSPEKVAAFYRKALAKYGAVLDCSKAQATDATAAEESKKKPSKVLTCEDEKTKQGEISLKSGTKTKEHAVGIQPNSTGTLYQLVYVETRGTND
jgi:hypothetical protein